MTSVATHYIVCGAESAGNRLVTGIMLSARSLRDRAGSGSHNQPSVDEWIERGGVIIKHRPAGLLARFASAAVPSAPPPLVLVTREPVAHTRSMVARKHVSNEVIAKFIVDQHPGYIAHLAVVWDVPLFRVQFERVTPQYVYNTVGIDEIYQPAEGRLIVDGRNISPGDIDPLGANRRRRGS